MTNMPMRLQSLRQFKNLHNLIITSLLLKNSTNLSSTTFAHRKYSLRAFEKNGYQISDQSLFKIMNTSNNMPLNLTLYFYFVTLVENIK